MQIDKYYIAIQIRKEINDMQKVVDDMEDTIVTNLLDTLSPDLKTTLIKKGNEIIKKELQRLIKAKEKEFSDL